MADQLVLPFEEWRQIVDWPDYEISSLGRVRRCRDALWRNAKNGKLYPRQRAGTLLTPGINKKTGYPHVTLHASGGSKKDINVHTLVCVAFHGPPPSPDHEVAHGDGSRSNNVWTNLRWATHQENAADMIEHGRTNRGTAAHQGKLCEEQVREIRKLSASGLDNAAIGRLFGVRRSSVRQIIKRLSWAWLD
jgi:hypothetical protein